MGTNESSNKVQSSKVGWAALTDGMTPEEFGASPLGWALGQITVARLTGKLREPADLHAYRETVDAITNDPARREALRKAIDATTAEGWGEDPSIAGDLAALARETREVADVLHRAACASWQGSNDQREEFIAEARKRLAAVLTSDVFDLATPDA